MAGAAPIMEGPPRATTAAERRKQVMLGELPADFLRITPTGQQQQIAADEQTAMALQHHFSQGGLVSTNVSGRLSITVVEAKLVKNYGVTRMDPYVRLRIGHSVYETHTAYNGAKNPRWNKIFHCYIPTGVNTFSIEIFDECAFTLDERIAWGAYTIPEVVFSGETVEDWFPLSGKQGDGKEGLISIVLSYTSVAGGPIGVPAAQPVVVVPPTAYPCVMPYYTPAAAYPVAVPQPVYVQSRPPPQPVVISEDDIKQVQEMFPDIDREVVKTVLESNAGNKDRTINALLTMSNES